MSKARSVTDEMFVAASSALAACVSEEQLATKRLYPEIRDLRAVEAKVGILWAERRVGSALWMWWCGGCSDFVWGLCLVFSRGTGHMHAEGGGEPGWSRRAVLARVARRGGRRMPPALGRRRLRRGTAPSHPSSCAQVAAAVAKAAWDSGVAQLHSPPESWEDHVRSLMWSPGAGGAKKL